MSKTIWVTRDGKHGEEPDLLMLHANEPELDGGTWQGTPSGMCMEVPKVMRGQCVRITLEEDALRKKVDIVREHPDDVYADEMFANGKDDA